MIVKPDPDYDFVEPLPAAKRGKQCGNCGRKFDYSPKDRNYVVAPSCAFFNCPLGIGQTFTISSQS